VEEGEVVVGLAVAAGRDPAERFQPGVGALDRPALARVRVFGLQSALLAAPDLAGGGAGRDRVAFFARLADPGADAALGECLLVGGGGIAAVGEQFLRDDLARAQRVEQRQQVALLVLVARREQDRER
jgi:hypothetical protein